VSAYRIETDSLGEVEVPADKLWGAQTERSLKHFSIGDDAMPRGMIHAYATLKKAAANVNHGRGLLDGRRHALIVRACDEILAGRHEDQFPLRVWMTGSGTQLNMNVNEVISNRCCQLAGAPLGGKEPVHPNDHANLSQSSNDSFPAAMCIAAATATVEDLLPSVRALRDALDAKARAWDGIVKIGRTHLQDAIPLTLGQELSGYVGMLDDAAGRVEQALAGVYRLALGGTAVGTGVNAPPGFDVDAAAEIAGLTRLPFTRWCTCMAPTRRWPWPCSRSRTTSGSCPAGRAAASRSCACRPTSPARRSCPARSTRPSARRCRCWRCRSWATTWPSASGAAAATWR
jgi:fumarate hydratase class II